jgi:hypothetical protein
MTQWEELILLTTTPATTMNISSTPKQHQPQQKHSTTKYLFRPQGVTVTAHLEDDKNELKKIRNQKRNVRRRLAVEHRQQVGNSFDYSNSDLRNVINIGRDARTVIIARRKEREEVDVRPAQ